MADYYYLDAENRTRGRFDLDEMWLLLEQGLLQRESSVNDGGEHWQPLHAYPELACRLDDTGVARKRPPREMIVCVVLAVLFPFVGLFLGIVDALRSQPRRSQGGVLLASSILALAVYASLFGWLRMGKGAPGASTANGTQKWEYKVVVPNDDAFIADMNKMGQDGWELISARRANNGPNNDMSYEVILKRSH